MTKPEIIAALRAVPGETVRSRCAAWGISPPTFYNWRRGRPPAARFVPLLAEIVGCTPADIIRAYSPEWFGGEAKDAAA